ncbi:Choline transport protein [Paramyrothecium foliicola]|nr:Choline transport protein [Paramyrothecium foliicola]
MESDLEKKTASKLATKVPTVGSLADGNVVDLVAIDADEAQLRANGHTTVMKRQFRWIAALGLAFTITNSWVGYLSNFGQNVIYGGPRSVIIGLLCAFFAQFTITLGLAEIASAFPSSGGQYHFVFILAPESSRRFLAYFIGWVSTLAWWIVTCSGTSLFAATLSGIIGQSDDQYAAAQWQIYLIYVGAAVVTVAPVILAPKKVSWTVQIGLYITIIGFAITLFTCAGMHSNAQPSSFLVDNKGQGSGWNSGAAFLLGISNAMYAFGGTDGVIHISEEMTRPGRRVPQVMVITMLIGLCTCFPLMIALFFFVNDIEAVAHAPLPSMELVRQATGSESVTYFLVSIFLIVYLTSLPSQWVSSGRLAWAFARDNGVPFAKYFSHIDEKRNLPLRTTVASLVFACFYGLLYLASTTAFNSIVTSAVLFLNISYAAPQIILLFRGRSKHLPPRYLNLGLLGYLCNGFSTVWIGILTVLVCMPPSLPVTVGAMNYTSVVLVGLLSIVVALWFITGRKVFQGPNIDWEQLYALNNAILRQ